MEIITAKTAGFCFGVSRAVKMAYDAVENNGGRKVYSYGPIIHNNQVISDLESKGVKTIHDTEIIEGNSLVIIESHGVGEDIIKKIEDRGADVINATCPFVDKIHRIVNDYHNKGYMIIIAGNAEHPEVVGINGWCGNQAVIVGKAEDAEKLRQESNKVCIVSQTTNEVENWDKIKKELIKKYPDAEIFDTICNATYDRQEEAKKIAAEVDAMIVVGSKISSNTKNLYSICGKICQNTIHVETSSDISYNKYIGCKKIGITAGASTPDWVIKEVIEKMGDISAAENETSFKEMYEESLVSLKTGDIVKGTVIQVRNNEVYVNIGYKSDGIIPAGEYSNDPDIDIEKEVKEGQEIEAFVVRVNDVEGTVILSRRKMEVSQGLKNMENAYKNQEVLTGKITEIVNGGVIAMCRGIKVFIPASQLSDRFIENFDEFLNKTVPLKIITFDRHKNKIVGSSKAVMEQERKEKVNTVWDNIEIGKRYTGTVKNLVNFGAFVDIGGVDGLIYISEISWQKINHPSEVLKVGEQVEVSVINFDREKKKISLSLREVHENPWNSVASKYKVGDIVKGKVLRLVPFGAFVELEPGVDALVHISQISNKRINRPADVLSVGQEVGAKIVELDQEKQKISLSIKEVEPIDSKVKDEEK